MFTRKPCLYSTSFCWVKAAHTSRESELHSADIERWDTENTKTKLMQQQLKAQAKEEHHEIFLNHLHLVKSTHNCFASGTRTVRTFICVYSIQKASAGAGLCRPIDPL